MPGRPELGGNYIWYLAIVVTFLGLGRAKRRWEVLMSSYGGRRQRTRPFFMGGVDPSRHHAKST